jgi:vitellogenic carboxypeptidase-like protein
VQGQFDVQDGVASTNAWIKGLRWDFLDDFEDQEGQLWYANSNSSAAAAAAAGWARSVSTLTQVVIRNAGHMVPRDQPEAALFMIEQWIQGVLGSQDDPSQDDPSQDDPPQQGLARGRRRQEQQQQQQQQQQTTDMSHWREELLQAV